MSRLSDREKSQLLEPMDRKGSDSVWRPQGEKLAINATPSPASRLRYMMFATEAARFFKGTKPVRFDGAHWRL